MIAPFCFFMSLNGKEESKDVVDHPYDLSDHLCPDGYGYGRELEGRMM